MKTLKQILSVLTAIVFSAVLFAQETTSEIQGTITDENGSPLAGATVTALHTPTGTVVIV